MPSDFAIRLAIANVRRHLEQTLHNPIDGYHANLAMHRILLEAEPTPLATVKEEERRHG